MYIDSVNKKYKFLLIMAIGVVLQLLYPSCVSTFDGRCIVNKEYKNKIISPSSIAITPLQFEDTSLKKYQDKIIQEIRIVLMRNCSSIFTFRNVEIPCEYLVKKEATFNLAEPNSTDSEMVKPISFNRYKPRKKVALSNRGPDSMEVPRIKGLSFNGYKPEVLLFVRKLSTDVRMQMVSAPHSIPIAAGPAIGMGGGNEHLNMNVQSYYWMLCCHFQYVFWNNVNGDMICIGEAIGKVDLSSNSADDEDYIKAFSQAFYESVKKSPFRSTSLDLMDF